MHEEGERESEIDFDVSQSGTHFKEPEIRTYHRRWYLLLLFCLVSHAQGAAWNTWGPIAQSAKLVFHWSNGIVALTTAWGQITSLIGMFAATYVMDVKGLRVAMVGCIFLLTLGCGLRCITLDAIPATWLINTGQILVGFAGCIAFGGAPLMSSTWFPPSQRATATAVILVFSYGGDATSFILGPLLVRQQKNNTLISNSTEVCLTPVNSSNSTGPTDEEKEAGDIHFLMIIALIWVSVLFLAVLIYFPSKPPLPPSKSASMGRIKYGKGLKDLSRHPRFWLITFAFAMPTGIHSLWGTALDIILQPVGIGQEEAGWLGFYGVIGGCVSSLLVSRFSDVFAKRIKISLVIMYSVGAAAFIWFNLICMNIIPFSTAQLYGACVLGGMMIDGTIPLFYELGCECSYPIAEGITSGYMTMTHNLFGGLFLLTVLIPGVGTAWMNWGQLGAIIIAIPILFAFKESYQRSDVDNKVAVSQINEQIPIASISYENVYSQTLNMPHVLNHACYP